MKNLLFKAVAKTTSVCFILLLMSFTGHSQKTVAYIQKDSTRKKTEKSTPYNKRIFYGLASFYSNKFHGKRTANGEIFNQDKFTAACNILPLGTWIKVTNLKNGRSCIVKTTDRLHPKMRRLVDLSRVAAKKLGYIKNGLTRVKVEVLNQKSYKKVDKR